MHDPQPQIADSDQAKKIAIFKPFSFTLDDFGHTCSGCRKYPCERSSQGEPPEGCDQYER